MKGIIGFLAGIAIGGIASYIYWKRKFEVELDHKIESMRETRESVDEYRRQKEWEGEAIEPASAEGTKDISTESDASETSDDDLEDGIDSGFGSAYSDDPYAAERDAVLDEYEKEIEDSGYYIREGYEVSDEHPYNITAAEYRNDGDYTKARITVYQNDDKACDTDTGIEIEDWQEILGEEYGNLEVDHDDGLGYYVRNPITMTDYEVTWSVFDWVYGLEDEDDD